MLNDKQIGKVVEKIKRFENMLESKIFEKVDTVDMKSYQTKEQLYVMPMDKLKNIKHGDAWAGEESTYIWLEGKYVVKDELKGQNLYVMPKLGGYEGMLFVNDMPYGIFATKIAVDTHGNHYCNKIANSAKSGETIKIGLEFYSGHYIIGCQPFEDTGVKDFNFTYDEVAICVKNDVIADFYFNLRTVTELYNVLAKNTFRSATLVNALLDCHKVLYYDMDNVSNEEFMLAINEANEILKPVLAMKNGDSMPTLGIIGHSHMDTAWLWHIDETIKKCARTFANQLNLMEQYPEYRFIQSSAYHTAMLERHYPQLFEKIKEKILEGRYEPNGGVWVECDCNITSGESMVRQFLWGQKYTQKHFGYTSDCFWLPDTFGYSAAIPQIMKGSKVDYFLTTKMSWNDVTRFPFTSFYWKGIDGTKVLAHLNKLHMWPSPADVCPATFEQESNEGMKQFEVSDKRIYTYGYGDGGGGPQFEMIEMARRSENLEGMPKLKQVSASEYMKEIESTIKNPSTHTGELYLELHRGTLTNQHDIKRNNRKAEIKLHDLEYLTVRKAIDENVACNDSDYRDCTETMLVHQFHDILPGSSIHRVHKEAKEVMGKMISEVDAKIYSIANESGDKILVTNTLSFDRNDVIYVDAENVTADYIVQKTENINGEAKLAVMGMTVPAFSTVSLEKSNKEIATTSAFKRSGNVLETPFATVTFDDKMYIESLFDKKANREVRGDGYALGTLLFAEDIPTGWDNWDIDKDLDYKFRDSAKLLSTKLISDGMIEYRIRNEYALSDKSNIKMDMIFTANSEIIRYDLVMDWQEEHRFLKVAFDTEVYTDHTKQEIQFGYLSHGLSRNNDFEQAKFEIVNHKYSDLSENNYGVAVLNDCKYGISVENSQMRLSLHKSGMRPDHMGDKGTHVMSYALLPHNNGFSFESVIKPAYEFNYNVVLANGEKEKASLVKLDNNNVIVEAIKPCEDGEKAFIVRLYEASGSMALVNVDFGIDVVKVESTNLLEEVIGEACETLRFKPFEIKTLKVSY